MDGGNNGDRKGVPSLFSISYIFKGHALTRRLCAVFVPFCFFSRSRAHNTRAGLLGQKYLQKLFSVVQVTTLQISGVGVACSEDVHQVL